MKKGTLYGIGVGPGDPDLITVKAVRVLNNVAVIFSATSTKNAYSLAADIVSSHLKKETPIVLLGFPMTYNKDKLSIAWEENARKVIDSVTKGLDVACITLGDPMTYSTFGYLMRTIKEKDPDIRIKIIPGITSYQAASASVGQVLVEGDESLTIVSGAPGAKKLKDIIDHSDNIIMVKVYHHYKEIIRTLDELNLTSKAILVSHSGLDGEEIVHDLKKNIDKIPPYLSILLIRKKD
ncbi:MAG: precorrin-2 C(20)-methyltransferase [Deltaproteobacteria bacterium]|nr:precorrin-2 C(20)-methyltransferase [Deltaproteobacteria bacterium]MCD6264721.1 precorrin-2 C(20)-methyltransferase [Deltaproteobacteria bacterium]